METGSRFTNISKKGSHKCLFCLSFDEFQLATNNVTGYDLSEVSIGH